MSGGAVVGRCAVACDATRAALVVTGLACAALTCAAGGAATLAGQSPQEVRPAVARQGGSVVRAAALTVDTVSFGDPFELVVELTVPTGSEVLMPERVPAAGNVEGVGPPTWTAAAVRSGLVDVEVRYPLVGYVVGPGATPELVVAITPAAGTPDAPHPRVVLYGPGPGTPPPGPSTETHSVPSRSVWIASLLRAQDVAAGLQPRPADDVIGRSWNLPAVGLGAASMLLLLLVSGSAIGDLVGSGRRSRAPTAPPLDPLRSAREAALRELDALLAEGLAPRADARAFYARSTDVVRRYVEALDGRWGPFLTSSELVGVLSEREGPAGTAPLLDTGAAPGGGARPIATQAEPARVATLRERMRAAEAVKFGGARPDGKAALEHCRTLRSWVASA